MIVIIVGVSIAGLISIAFLGHCKRQKQSRLENRDIAQNNSDGQENHKASEELGWSSDNSIMSLSWPRVVDLYHYQGMNMDDIASELDVSTATVSNYMAEYEIPKRAIPGRDDYVNTLRWDSENLQYVENLPKNQELCFKKYILQRKSINQVADELEMSRSAVSQTVTRAINRINELSEIGMSSED